ncbi:hypothetical protein F5879DRAFT_936150 [Lentinula edodes]|nr:hypothetical protein F5879DRAFT_936150 [Lentinula edodes]
MLTLLHLIPVWTYIMRCTWSARVPHSRSKRSSYEIYCTLMSFIFAWYQGILILQWKLRWNSLRQAELVGLVGVGCFGSCRLFAIQRG